MLIEEKKVLSLDERLKGVNLTYRDVCVDTGNSSITVIETEQERQLSKESIVYPIVVVSNKADRITIIGKAILKKNLNGKSPVLKEIQFKPRYSTINGLNILVINSLFERFGEYNISKSALKDAKTVKFLIEVLECKSDLDFILYSEKAYKGIKTIENRIRGG